MSFQKLYLFTVLITVFAAVGSVSYAQEKCTEVYGSGPNKFSLATGSPGELGLIKVLEEAFSKDMNTTLCWKKAGSGEALRLLKEKAVDIIMVHDPTGEKKALAEGWAMKRALIGSNEFYIVGPSDDPAKIAEAGSVLDAHTRIAKAKVKYFSRGDNSGTHKKEMEIWKKTGILPSGDWYLVTKDFMSVTLRRANDEKGYFMTDSSTWVAERNNFPNLRILFSGDKFLVNTYHALCQPEGMTLGATIAAKFIDFVTSEKGQKIMREYGKDLYGEGLYNDAAYARKYEE